MKKVPNLRFKEFKGEWEQHVLGDIFEFYTTNSFSRDFLDNDNGSVKNIHYGDIHMKFPTLLNIKNTQIPYVKESVDLSKISLDSYCKNGDVVIADASEDYNDIGKAIELKSIGEEKIIAGLHTILARDNKGIMVNGFRGYLMTSPNVRKQIKVYAAGAKVLGISKANISKVKLLIPSGMEQEKIAAFFYLIDKKIGLQTEKVEELKNYKKGLLQKIFSQELRFKDENGNEYPEWEEKTLQQIGFTYAGLSGKTKEDFGFGNGSFVTYINVFRNTLAKRMIEQVNISEQENQNPVLKGDLLFTTSSETPNEVGMVSCWDYEIKNLYLNSFCFGYRIYNHNSYSPIFLAYMLRSGEYRKKISILAQGSTRYNISKTELMKMKVQCPCMEEQQKIVALLLNLELKTEEEQNKLNELLQYKKGLLQQMFI